MAMEKQLKAVPPQLFTADGTAVGLITVADTRFYKVKQQVILAATGQTNLTLEIKRVADDGSHTMFVGPIAGNIDARTDISAFTVAAGAYLFANQQKRPSVPEQEIERLTYEEEPTVARRVVLVDEYGNKYDNTNPVPVAATFSGEVKVGDIRITAADNDPVAGDQHSSVRISDGSTELKINPDGSLNVVVETGSGGVPPLNIFNSITSVPSGVSTTLLTYTVPPATTAFMYRIEYGGDNIAQYDVMVNGVLSARRRTYFGGQLADTFEFAATGADGYMLNAGDIVQLMVFHNRPMLGAFEARLQATLI